MGSRRAATNEDPVRGSVVGYPGMNAENRERVTSSRLRAGRGDVAALGAGMRLLQCIAAVGLLIAAGAAGFGDAWAPGSGRPADTVVLLNCGSSDEMWDVVAALETAGGAAHHVFPPHVLIGEIPADVAQWLVRDPRVDCVSSGEINPASVPASYGQMARDAIAAWNRSLEVQPAAPPGPVDLGRPLTDDALERPLTGPVGLSGQSAASPPGAGRWQTSEYMMGKVVVSVILPESSGAIDADIETWSSAQQATVVSEIVGGMEWWRSQYPYAAAPLTFVYDLHYSVPTGYEPIKHPRSEEGLWISQVMAALGHGCDFRSYLDAVIDHDSDLRESNGADWAFTIFVVGSSRDGDGEFPDGYFAYAYLGGPLMVMTYTNDGWGIGNMDRVAAHEAGHIFGAGDEYCEPGYSCCDPNTYYGYLRIVNSNCASGVTCVMAGNDDAVCPVTRQQLGWRDSDQNGCPDVLDVAPTVTISAGGADTTDTTPSFSGLASVTAYPNQLHPGEDVTLNRIAGVQFRVDGGGWQECQASDGEFGDGAEEYAFTTPPLEYGAHTIEARATDSSGSASAEPYPRATVTVGPAQDEFAVCTAPSTQWCADISGNIVVWSDMRDSSMQNSCDVWGYDLTLREESALCTAAGGQWYPAVRDEIVVWQDYRDQTMAADIIGYDFATDKEFVVQRIPREQGNPAVGGGVVVWEDQRNDPGNRSNTDLYGYDLQTNQEFAVCTAAGSQVSPAVAGRWVVWADWRNDSGSLTNSDIYAYDLLTGQEMAITDGGYKEAEPAVYGDVVVWADFRNDPGDGSNPDIYGRNLRTGEAIAVCTAPGAQRRPAIFGDVVVWEDYRNDRGDGSNADIYGRDLATGEESPVCLARANQRRPAISGDTVVWEDDRDAGTSGTDIYGCRLSSAQSLAIAVKADPPSIGHKGTTQLRATLYGSLAYQVTWEWDDGEDGGVFSPNPYVESPTYTGPGNEGDAPVARRLTVVAMCQGSPPQMVRAELTVMEGPKLHLVEVAVAAQPARIRSGGTVALTAEANDTMGHGIVAWEWSDGGAGGTFTPNATTQNPTYTAPAGTDATITLTASARCDASVSVVGSGSVTVTAHDFVDVPADWWAADEVYACYSAGIVSGYPDGRYMPSASVTRDQMAVYISRALAGGDEHVPSGPAQATFADVPVDHWAYSYIEYVNANQIAMGYPDGRYLPEKVVDRGQMAVFVARAMAQPTGEAGLASFTPPLRPTFRDVTATNEWSWCHRHVEYIASRQVAAGYPDGLYHPEYACARDQMAVYVARAFGLVR